MNGIVNSLAPKPIRKTESTYVSEKQATAQAAQAFQANWSDLPAVLISTIGFQLNKRQVAFNLRHRR